MSYANPFLILASVGTLGSLLLYNINKFKIIGNAIKITFCFSKGTSNVNWQMQIIFSNHMNRIVATPNLISSWMLLHLEISICIFSFILLKLLHFTSCCYFHNSFIFSHDFHSFHELLFKMISIFPFYFILNHLLFNIKITRLDSHFYFFKF